MNSNILRAVRAFFGLRQRELAPWLGLRLTTLGNIEAGLKALPRHAEPWLHVWMSALIAGHSADPLADLPLAPAAAPALPDPGTATGPAAVLARLAECDYQARRLEQRLAALLAGQRLAARRLAAGPLLLAALPPLPPPGAPAEATALALRRRWLARLREEATDQLSPGAATGPVATVLLTARHRACLHEAACLRAWLSGEETR